MTDMTEPTPPLYGLVLAGGLSTRYGRDKGGLDFHGSPQVRWAQRLLEGLCDRCFVSIRAEQSSSAIYRDEPVIIDAAAGGGPAAGLLAALRRFPGAAWCVVAADMPLLERALLARLVTERDPGQLATAFARADGACEPLCAIWEPRVLRLLEAAPEAAAVSLSGLLRSGPTKRLSLSAAEEGALRSVNTPEDEGRVRARLASRT